MVVRGGLLAFFPFNARGGHFDPTSALLSYSAQAHFLSYSAWAPLLVNGLGPDHLYSLGYGLGSQ